MIKAKHNYFARKLFDLYIDKLMKKSFSHFYFMNQLPKFSEDATLILTPNHFSWWDGFFIDFLNRKLIKRKIHVLMLDNQLKKFWFFRFVGAFSIDLENKKTMIHTFKYVKELLKDSRNLVVIYPQGKIEPFDSVTEIKEGVKIFANLSENVCLIPVAFKIQFNEEMKPDIYSAIGESISNTEIKENFNIFQQRFLDTISKVDQISKSNSDLINLFESKK